MTELEITSRTRLYAILTHGLSSEENLRHESIDRKSGRKVKIEITWEPEEKFTDKDGKVWKRVT